MKSKRRRNFRKNRRTRRMSGVAGATAAMAGFAGELGLGSASLGSVGTSLGVGSTMSAATVGGLLTGGISVGVGGLSAAILYGLAKRKRKKLMNHIINLFKDATIIERLRERIKENDLPDSDYKFTGISEKKYKILLKKWFLYMGGRKIFRKTYTLHYLMEIDMIERNINMPLEEKITKFHELLSGGVSKYLGWWSRALVEAGIVSLPMMDKANIKQYFKISKQMRSQHKKTEKIADEARNVIMD